MDIIKIATIADSSEAVLEAKNISFTYPHSEKKAVHDISFSIKKGSYTAILGPNGSGKSTLGRILAGVLTADEGSITYGSSTNENISKTVPIGIVFQSPKHQIIAGKVIKDAAFGPVNIGFTKTAAEVIAQKELEKTNLAHKSQENTLSLSLGQTQKLALSGILALNPNILLLDEAVSMIDPEWRSEILDYIGTLHSQGKTILTITHDLDEALRAENIIIMDEGSIFNTVSADDFLKQSELQEKIFGNNKIKKRTFKEKENPQAALILKDVSFGYTDLFFSNIDLTFEKGSITAVMGESGSGKSTLFELIAGLLQPESGSIRATCIPSLALQDSESALFEEFAIDDIAFGPKNKGIEGKKLKNIVITAMKSTGLDFTLYKDKKTFLLSGGEKRKIAVAGIIALDEDIILFDEPTAGLDPKSRYQILQSIQSLANSGKTIIFSTHRKEETLAADRCIILDEGTIAFDDKPSTLPPHNNLSTYTIPESRLLRSIRNGISGDYTPRNSLLHKAKPGIKFLIFFTLFTLSIAFQSIPLLCGISILCLIYAFFSKYPLKKLIKRILKVLPWLAFFFVFQMLFFGTGKTDTIIWKWFFISITEAKIQLSLRTVLHFLSAVISFSVYFYTAEESDIIDGIEDLLGPLKKIRFPVRHLTLLILLVLRFIPLLLDETSSILKTQIIRHGMKKKKGLFKTIRSFIPLFVPLILQTLKRAETLTEAIQARYYK